VCPGAHIPNRVHLTPLGLRLGLAVETFLYEILWCLHEIPAFLKLMLVVGCQLLMAGLAIRVHLTLLGLRLGLAVDTFLYEIL